MKPLFFAVLRLSAEASLVAVAVMLVRLLLSKRMAKSVTRVLWAAVFLRAALPWHMPRLIPRSAAPDILPKGFLTAVWTGGEPAGYAPAAGRAVTAADYAAWIWLAVAVMLLLALAALYWRAGRRLCHAAPAETPLRMPSGKIIPVYVSDAAASPLVWGIFRPRVVLPPACGAGGAMRLILTHERIHIQRRDYLLKPLALGLLAVHWFNPVLWLAFWLWSRDTEFSCDERAVRETGDAAAYANALLDMAARQNGLLQCGFAAGKSGVGKRIRAVLRERKTRRWPAACAALVTCGALLCAFTGAGQGTAGTLETLPQQGERAMEPAADAGNAGQTGSLVETGMAWPAPGLDRVSTAYGWRFDGADFHSGVDITMENADDAYRKPVYPAADGVVTHVVTNNTPGYGYGKYMLIDHGDGIFTLYAHCSELLVKEGDSVKRDQIIALVGSTGFSTEPHLHFEVRVNGYSMDPLLWTQANGLEARREAFEMYGGTRERDGTSVDPDVNASEVLRIISNQRQASDALLKNS